MFPMILLESVLSFLLVSDSKSKSMVLRDTQRLENKYHSSLFAEFSMVTISGSLLSSFVSHL